MKKEDLITKIIDLIKRSKREKIFFLLGHLPLDYLNEEISNIKWGNFSEYTLGLGLEIAQKIIQEKEVKFFFLVDDKGTIDEIKTFNSTQMSRIRKKVYSNSEKYYQSFFETKLKKYGFNEKNTILQKSERRDRNNLKLHSELLLSRDSQISNVCAGSYHEIVKKFGVDHLIVSFIPSLCNENICITAINMLDLDPNLELINCYMEINKHTEDEILESCILKSSFEEEKNLFKSK